MSTLLNPAFLSFQYAYIVTAKHDGEILVSADAVADAIGLKGHQCYGFSNSNRRLFSYVTEYGLRTENFITLFELNTWLYSIKPGYIRDDATRRRLAAYRDKAGEVIFLHWNGATEINRQLAEAERKILFLRAKLARTEQDLESWRSCCQALKNAVEAKTSALASASAYMPNSASVSVFSPASSPVSPQVYSSVSADRRVQA